MDLSALHSKRLGAAAAFVAATLVLAVQLITPSPVVVAVGEHGAQTTRLGRYFTYTDVSIIAVTAVLLGASGVYLLFHDPGDVTTTDAATRRAGGDESGRMGTDEEFPRGVDDGESGGSDRSQHGTRRHERWEETLDRLHDKEETVYAAVLDAGGELPQRDVVEETDLSKASVSRALDALETRGVAERKRRGMGNVVVLQ
jgi:uncharacterized membrane protein